MAGTMVNLIRKLRRWLDPAVPDTSTRAQDTSSMADLVRLLGTGSEPGPPAGGQGKGRANDADRPAS